MNIDQYRAIKAQDAAQPAVEQPQVQQPSIEKSKEESPKVETAVDKITLDGVGEVTIDELKNGYLRQSDYTQKTQEVSRQRKEAQDALALYEYLRQNPQAAHQLKQSAPIPAAIDPNQAKVVELESKVYDMMLEREIEGLQKKYPDFEIRSVLQVAHEKGINNLDDAYHLYKSRNDTPDSLKERLRQEILKEMETEKSGTSTIISGKADTPVVRDNAPRISSAEQKVAKMMKLSDVEYVKWRDADLKKK